MTRSEKLEQAIRSEQTYIWHGQVTGSNNKLCAQEKERHEFLLSVLLADKKRSEGCAYEQIDDDQNVWKCDKCGEEWCFTEGGVIENNTDYCPKCGLPILRVITHGWDEDYNKTTTVTERDPTEGESV